MYLFDAHCHLQDKGFGPDISGVIAGAHNSGVRRVVCCGTSEADWGRVAELKNQYYDFIVPAFGLHPWYVKAASPSWLSALESFLGGQPSGVGEIGLDFAIDGLDKEQQQDVLSSQLELAVKLKRPVCIHCRKAWGALESIFKKNGPLPAGGLIHSYSGSADMVPVWESYGLSISFSGTITYTNNKRARKSLAAVSPQRLLAETDSPDLKAFGVTDKVNQPANIVLNINTMSELLKISREKCATLTYENAARLFNF